MIKRVLAVSLMGLSLAGCVNNDSLSGDVYTASEAKQVQNVTYGTIVNVRPVQIQGGDDSNVIGAIGGAVLGGFLGNTIGGGTGRSLATAAGAVAGGVAGRGVQSAMNKTRGVELEIVKTMATPLWLCRNKEIRVSRQVSVSCWPAMAARLLSLHAKPGFTCGHMATRMPLHLNRESAIP